MMPAQIDTPNAIRTDLTIRWAPRGTAASAVDGVQTNDGDTSGVWCWSGGLACPIWYTFPPISGVADPVTAASFTSVARWVNGPTWADGEYKVIWNSAQCATNWDMTLKNNRPNYTTLTEAMAAGQLALAAVNGLHGIHFRGASATEGALEYWVTHIYRTLDFGYTSGSAGEFAQFVGSLVGALIGSGLSLREMPALSRLMRLRHGKWLRQHEYEPAWRDWIAQKRMVLV